jgi:hypothetical protein
MSGEAVNASVVGCVSPITIPEQFIPRAVFVDNVREGEWIIGYVLSILKF